MNDTAAKVLGALALVAALVGGALPILGVNASLAAELTTILASLGAIAALYFHTAPDLPMPAAWQETLGKIGLMLGSAAVFAPLVLKHEGLSDSGVAKATQLIGLAVGLLSAYAKKSPGEARTAGGAALLAVALLLSPAAAEAATSTSSAAPSRIGVTVNAQAGSLHFDGSLGVGPALCFELKLSSAVNPVGCAYLEAARSSASGDVSGRLGPQLGVSLPALEALGLKSAPAVVVGWSFVKIGPGEFFDKTKGAFLISGSFPFLGL
jgi:hypothetical protein